MSSQNNQGVLHDEARQRPRAALVALVAGALALAGFIDISVGRNSAVNQPAVLLYVHEHASALLLAACISAAAALGAAGSLLYLLRFTRARRPELPPVLGGLAVVGGIAAAASGVVFQIATAGAAAQYATHGSLTYNEAQHVVSGGAVAASRYVGLAAALALAVAFALLSLNAMRVGLLTRFMGYLGVFAGIAAVLLGTPIIEAFWLIALAFLFAGRWPAGTPRAWDTGQAEPWPTAQELREQRDAARGGAPSRPSRPAAGARAGGTASARPTPPTRPRFGWPRPSAPEPEPATAQSPVGSSRPGAARRKRKKRK